MAITNRLCQHLAGLTLVAMSTAGLTSCVSADLRQSPEGQEVYGSDFDRGAERGPSINTLSSVAHVMAAQGRDRECELVLLKLVDTHPHYLPAYNELAELYMRQGDIEAARAILWSGLEVEQHDTVLLNNMGMCQFLNGAHEAALDWFTQASGVDPKDARSRANMAASLGMLGRADEALAVYYTIVPPTEAHYNLAVLCESVGNHERAAEEFALAKELE